MRGPHVRFCERREGAILRAYSTSKTHGSRRPDPRVGVKARVAPRAAGLALTPSTGRALPRDDRDETVSGGGGSARLLRECWPVSEALRPLRVSASFPRTRTAMRWPVRFAMS